MLSLFNFVTETLSVTKSQCIINLKGISDGYFIRHKILLNQKEWLSCEHLDKSASHCGTTTMAMAMAMFSISLHSKHFPSPMLTTPSSTKCLPSATAAITSRRAMVFGSGLVIASWFNLANLNSPPLALAELLQDELQQEEDNLVQLFQVDFFVKPL